MRPPCRSRRLAANLRWRWRRPRRLRCNPPVSTGSAVLATSWRLLLPLWLGYLLLMVAGMLSGRSVFSVLAVMALVSAVALPHLQRGQPRAWIGWLLALALVGWIGVAGYAELLLEAVPMIICALLAWWFARSVLVGRPLVARFIVAIEGEQRLDERDVARYARQLTLFWAILMSMQTLSLTLLWLGAEHTGLLARMGVVSPLHINDRWAALWLNAGVYVLLPVVFVLEYAYRRWRLRHLQHPHFGQFLRLLVLNWPRLLREEGAR